MGTLRTLSLLLGPALLAGCMAHVTVPPAPSRNAPLAERGRFYSTWRPVVLNSTIHYQQGTGTVTAQSTDAVTLANGTVVAHPEDLIPLVDESSRFAEGARRASRLTSQSLITVLTGAGITALGGLIFGVAAAQDGSVFSDDNRTLAMTGLGIMGGGALLLTVGAMIFSPRVNQSRRDAFLSLDAAMSWRMNLCSDPQGLRDCESAPTPAPTPSSAPAQGQPAAPTEPAPWSHKE